MPSPPSTNATASPEPRLHFFLGLRGIARGNLPAEIIAGVTLAALAIPLNIGYAEVAGLPPVTGLYAAVLPMAVYALFSSSRQLVGGPDAAITAVIGSLLFALAVPEDPRYVQLAYALALVCAVLFFAVWYFRLGFLANFLSRAVLVGFVSGLGIEIFTSQVPKILGFSVEGEEWIEKVVGIIQGLPQTNPYSVVVGVGTIVIIRVLKRFAPRIPGALVALILMTVVVAVFQLEQRGVSVLGAVPAGLPQLTLPRVTALDYLSLLPGAVAICGITLAEAVLVGRTYAERRGYPLDADQEMFAFGAANVVGGVTGSFVTGSSGSRTAAMDAAGSRSQIPGVVGAGVVAVVLVFFTPFLALLPSAALAGIVANAVLALVEIEGLRELKRLRQSEFAIALVCLASVLLLGTINAVVLAFLLTVIDVVRRAATPATAVLGELPDHRGQLVAADPEQLLTLPGLVIYRFGAALFFANADTFRRDVQRLVETSVPAPTWFVLDAEAISDIDTTGCDTLARALDDLQQRGVTFAMTRVAPSIHDLLRHYELLDRIGEEHLYRTNQDAVGAYLAASPPGTPTAPPAVAVAADGSGDLSR